MSLAVHTLVLSPHLDDGALSCGGEMHHLSARGERVVMATLCTADMGGDATSFARKVFGYMGLDWRSGMAARREEDVDACRLLRVEPLHFDLGEAINRYVPSGGESRCPYTSGRTLFGPPDADDERIVAERLDEILAGLPSARRWLVPLGIGGHVDHRLVRAAAERNATAEVELLYYEDFPYSRKIRNRLRVLGLLPRRALRPTHVSLQSNDLDRKIDSIAAYRSQIEPLFGGREQLVAAVRADARRCGGGERRWRLRA